MTLWQKVSCETMQRETQTKSQCMDHWWPKPAVFKVWGAPPLGGARELQGRRSVRQKITRKDEKSDTCPLLAVCGDRVPPPRQKGCKSAHSLHLRSHLCECGFSAWTLIKIKCWVWCAFIPVCIKDADSLFPLKQGSEMLLKRAW